MAQAAFKYSEELVSRQIGLPRDEIRVIREENFDSGVDFKKIRGEIMLTENAVWRLATLSLTKMPKLELCEPSKEPETPNGEHLPKKMRVVPPMPINPRIVYAMDEEGNRELVWVGRNGTFCFEDEIEVAPHPEQTGILICLSPIPRDRRRFPR